MVNSGVVFFALLASMIYEFQPSSPILFPDSPRLKTENGHLILESASGKNISLKTRGSGCVSVNGVDITQSYTLIEAVRPQLETLHQSSLEFLIRNLSRVVQNVASESRLAQTLDEFRNNLRSTTQDLNDIRTTVENSQTQLGRLRVNVTQLSAVAFTEEKERLLRNVTRIIQNLQRNGGLSGNDVSSQEIQNLRQRLSSVASRISDLDLLDDRVTALESTTGSNNQTAGGGTPVSARVLVEIQSLKRNVFRIKRTLDRVRIAVFTDDCRNGPCHNGGTCIDTTLGFTCLCPSGFEGISCNQDVNECVSFIGTDIGCQNGATCQNTVGSYSCVCPPGWYGVHCTQKTDSCSTSSATEICGHGTCIPTSKGGHPYTCLCDQGWTTSFGNPACIQDVNECMAEKSPCSHDPPVSCVNTFGSFRCGTCPPGYEGNGFVCRDIDECSTNNGGCSLLPRVECINTRPGRRCGPCPGGYTGDGTICQAVMRPCSMNPCHPLAVCMDNPQMSSTYFTCTCHHGYIGNGIGPTGCMPASSGGALVPSTNPCAMNPCLHGTCSVYMGQYQCLCLPGYTGHNCNQLVNYCASFPCLNGGNCTSTQTSFICNCPSSHTGDRCESVNRRCGGLLRGQGGVVDYPGEGMATYQHNISCAWVIVVNASLVITVKFTNFHLEMAPPSCRYDWLQIHDGPRSDFHLIGRFCGRTTPGVNGTIVSTHNHLYLWFRSDHSHAGSGFTFTWNATEPVCGQTIEGNAHGSINSPGYPGRYPRGRDCYWTVQVARGKKIQFAFATLQLEHHANCSYDFLEVRDGLSEEDDVLARFCSTQIPPPLITSGSEAFLHFHSDYNYQDTGFHITFVSIPGIPGCGGLLTDDMGEFSLPTIAREYAHNLQCEWEVRVPPGERISLNFTRFDIEVHRSCVYDFVEVRDGGDRDSPLVGRFCGNDIPSPIFSSGNRLFIYFKSDYSIAYEGFTIHYEVACGGEYSAITGIVESPYYPRSYPHNRLCVYVIKQAPGKAIVLNFTSFDLEAHLHCRYDYLEIRDGLSELSPLIGQYCGQGSRVPTEIISTMNGIYMKFRTDGSIANRGFQAVYLTIDVTCGGILQSTAGTISFPENAGSYPSNSDCRWILEMPPGYILQLTWQTFALEYHADCNYDYVEVFDNSSLPNSGGRIGSRRFCGTTLPPVMTSLENIMTVHFHSDSTEHHDGFSASYHALDATRVCGGNYHSAWGRIRSPNYPNNYPHHRECIWTISTPVNSQIKLNFTAFDLEVGGDNCYHDYLEIRNGGYEMSPLIVRLCGHNQTIGDIFSHTHQIFIKFHSDESISAMGFEVFWEQTATGCGGSLTSVTGEIISPGYPQPFHRFANCFWTIRSNQGSVLSLTFIDLDLPVSYQCLGTYVEVRDGLRSNSRLIGRYCSDQGLVALNSTSNEMSIKFQSDQFSGRRGFKVKYMSNCNAVLKKHFGVIESPNFPSLYPHDRNCTWVIMAPKGNSINISFSHFEVEDPPSVISGVCEYDFVELKVGRQTSPERIVKGHYCGSRLPPQFYSGQGMDVVEVRFKSDYSLALNGFRLEWTVHGCGGILKGFKGTFASMNYPNAYPVNTDCEWRIEGFPGMRIKITINEFDIESSFSSSQCTFDALKIYGGRDATSPVLLTLCHHEESPKIVTTQGNYAFMTMNSDGSVRGKGFWGTYELILGGCGGEFSAPKGEVHSPGYPGNYDNHADCIWQLSTDVNHVIEFEFNDFDVEPHNNCSYDYLALFDGNTTEAPLLLQHCGEGLPSPPIIRSSGRFMTVRLKADESSTGRGFMAEYRKGCGATLDVPMEVMNNEITSPNFPHMFTVYTNCTWHLRAQEGYKVMLRFTHLNIQQTRHLAIQTNETCRSDYVLVLDGDTMTSPEIGRYCGTHIPRPMFSTSRFLTVQLMTNMGYGVGFRSLFSSVDTACGGELSSYSGEIASPGYPDSYPRTYECIWIIRAGENNRMQLAFSYFDIEESEGCNLDYLEIHEESQEGVLLLHNCSSSLPEPSTATGGFWIKFQSDSQGSGGGFLATYSLLTSNEIAGDSGVIESPLYPLVFTDTQEFSWRITVNPLKYVSIFIEEISIEVNPVHDLCFSSLVIYNGFNENSQALRTLCGHTSPPEPIVSTGSIVFIKFLANFRHEGSKFRLHYYTVDEQPTTEVISVEQGPYPNCTFMVTVNGTATFQSPNYPNNYDNNMRCEWIIETEAHSRLLLQITYELEETTSCTFDKIEIYDGVDGRRLWNKTATLCQRNQSAAFYYSSGRFMKLRFKTDSSYTMKGFSASVSQVCGGVLNEPSGVIKSPNYPENYRRHSTCKWTIKVRRGRTIQLEFDDFRIANDTPSCSENYLLVYNGLTTSSPLLGAGRFCGRNAPTVPETSANGALLQFKSVYSSDKGFHITYHEVSAACGGYYSLSRDMTWITVSSPNYPNPSHPHTECIWIITGPPNKPLSVHFIEQFDITYSASCQNDFVEVRDGGTALSPLIRRSCGTFRPNPSHSANNIILIRYHTVSENVHVGFKAEVHMGRCGGSYRLMGGLLNSPKYPEPYDNEMNCTWNAIGPFGHYLIFNFVEVNIYNPSINCTASEYGILTINDTQSNSSVVLCTEGVSYPPFEISSNEAIIRFTNNHTGGSINRFRLTMSASREVCGGTVTGTEGVLQSPGYPLGLSHIWNCVWKIRGPPGSKITLVFEDMDLAVWRIFCMQYIMVYNGIEDYSPRLTDNLCGTNIPGAVNSSMNEMKILLKSYRPTQSRGFKLRWSSTYQQECGGILSTSAGYISSPGFSNGGYNHSSFCVWTLNNPNPSVSSVNLTISHPHLEGRCFDYILLQGITTSGQIIATKQVCHDEPELRFLAPYPTVKITFVSDWSINGTGFNISFSPSNCGGYSTGPEATFISPGYPSNYPPNCHCAWLFDYEEGTQVEIDFTDFNLENSLNHDFVKIYNGPDTKSPLVGHYSGGTSPGHVGPTMTNTILIIFESDGTNNARGFSAIARTHSRGCGGILHGIVGNFSSPGFLNNSNYPANTECVWEIRMEAGYQVKATFVDRFDLETSDGCQNDFVQFSVPVVTDGVTSWVPKRRNCGKQIPVPFKANSSSIQLSLRSNSAIEGKGFKVRYTGECGGIYTDEEGTIMSPLHPNPFPPGITCIYKIIAPQESYLSVNFSALNLRQHSTMGCIYSTIIMQEDNVNGGRGWVTLCGTTLPQPFLFTGTVTLNFTSDTYPNTPYTGFMLKYNIKVCGGNITQPTTIKLPSGPSMYVNNMNCIWDISAPERKVSYIKFQTLQIEHHRQCNYDYVGVYDGFNENENNLILKLCGHHREDLPVVTSRSKKTRIVFKSDSSMAHGRGFVASVDFTYACGGVININDSHPTDTIRSLDANNDGKYEPLLNCNWMIRTNSDRVVELNFTRLDVEGASANDTSPCPYDYIKVYDGPSKESPLMGMFCGSTLPQRRIATSGNIMFVTFRTDSMNQTGGFTAVISSIPRICGAPALTATLTPQVLESPNYLSEYPASMRCRWSIVAPENDRIALHINSFSLQQSVGCIADRLYIGERSNLQVAPQQIEAGSRGESAGWAVDLNGRRAYFSYGQYLDHTYCGIQFPHHLDSNSNEVEILFNSDEAVSSSGFRIHYSIATCNSTYTADSASITRPWNAQGNCYTTISVAANNFITLYFSFLQFTHRAIEGSFKIYDGLDTSAPILADLRGFTTPDPIFSSSSNLYIEVTQPSSGDRLSYGLNYATSEERNGCGGRFFGPGVITSPQFPGPPSSNLTCIYTIAVDALYHVAFRMDVMDFVGGGGCNSTYLEIYDVFPTNEFRLFSTFCQGDQPARHLSPSNRLIMRFVTGGPQLSGSGWRGRITKATPHEDTVFDSQQATSSP